jgi:hypothetical protein
VFLGADQMQKDEAYSASSSAICQQIGGTAVLMHENEKPARA